MSGDDFSFELGAVVACGLEKMVLGRVDMKELTLLERLLVAMLIQVIDNDTEDEYYEKILRRAGLTKQQARRAVAWDDE